MAAVDDPARLDVKKVANRSAVPPWLPLLSLFAILLPLAFRSAGPIEDPDTWWHLRLGEEFRGSWSPASPGQLSDFATRPWVSTQWLLEVVASYVHDLFGLTGIAWLGGVGVLVLGVVVFLSARVESSTLPASVATGLALFGASLSLDPRPQMASFILVGFFVAAWLRTSTDHKPRWWLVPASWIWACTHGMWFLGPLIGGAVVLGLLLDRRIGRGTALRLGAIPALGVAAAATTPVGPRLLFAPAATESMADFVSEWQPPDFTTTPAAVVTAVMLASTVLVWARSSSPVSWSRVLLLLMATGWTVYAYRTVALGAVMAAPLLAGALQSRLHLLMTRAGRRTERGTLAVAFVASLTALTLAVPDLSEPQGKEVPRQLNTHLEALDHGTVVYNAYEVGGWLEWDHRNVVPVIDPMLDAYPVGHMRDYYRALHLEKGWSVFVADSGARFALLRADSPLALELEGHYNWSIVASDSAAGYTLLEAPPTWPELDKG